jgi:TPR repeat protein
MNTSAYSEELGAERAAVFQLYASGKFSEAFPAILGYAEQGDAEAQNAIGDMYFEGKGIPRNYDSARKWYALSAEQDYPEALDNLGFMHLHGIGMSINELKAASYFAQSLKMNNALGYYHYGVIHRGNHGIPPDGEFSERLLAEALRLGVLDRTRNNAEKGFARDQTRIGYMHWLGILLPESQTEAMKWFRLAAEQGDSLALTYLAEMYAKGMGVEADLEHAVALMNQAAARNYVGAQAALGYLLCFKNAPNSTPYSGIELLERAARSGSSLGQTCLGFSYISGKHVKRDIQKGWFWLELAAQNHYEPAKIALDGFRGRFKERGDN